MVILNIETCLNQLSKEVQNKIIEKQDELFPSELDCLHKRLLSKEYRRKLLNNLSTFERKYFKHFIRKYSLNLNNNVKEELPGSTEEKLALLLLRQKGLIYEQKIDSRRANYLFPFEIIESFFDINDKVARSTPNSEPYFSTKNYLYLIMEMLFFIKDKKSCNESDFSKLIEQFSPKMNVSFLLKYLHQQGLVTKENDQFFIIENNCDYFFERPNKDIRESLALFFLCEYLDDHYIVMFIYWLLFYRQQKSFAISEIMHFVSEESTLNISVLNELFKQLNLLEIISINNEFIVIPNANFIEDDKKTGMIIGNHEFLIPIDAKNEVLWDLRCWGNFVQWEAMVHVRFGQETFRKALKMKKDIGVLIKHLEQYLPKDEVTNWQRTIKKWLRNAQSITKKENLTLYSVTEKLHLKLISEHWRYWFEETEVGIIIEKENEEEFENLLKEYSLTVIDSSEAQQVHQKEPEIKIISSFPEVSSAIPEFDSLPKQWFVLTEYDERTIQRVIKQAMILQLPIKVQVDFQEIRKLYPKTINIDNGSYVIHGRDGKKFNCQQIKKVAIIHPLEM